MNNQMIVRGNPMIDQMNSLNLNNNQFMMHQPNLEKRGNPMIDQLNSLNLENNQIMMNKINIMNNNNSMINQNNSSHLNNYQVVNSININNQIKKQIGNNMGGRGENRQSYNINNQIMNYNINNQNISKQNYNLNNQEMNSKNPIYMAEFIKKSKELYNFYGQINKNNIQNNITASRQTKKSQLERLPRNTKFNQHYNHFFHQINDSKLNFRFTTASGYTTVLIEHNNIKVYDLLCQYMIKINLSTNLIGNGICFIYNGSKIKKDHYNKLIKDFFKTDSNIIVIDSGNLIGS